MAKSPTTTTAPTGNIAPFGLRMLPEFKERVEDAAKESGRSMNAEIVERLARTFQSDEMATMMRANIGLLRALADFVVLRHNHPSVAESMEEAMVKLARAVKETKDDAKLLDAAGPAMTEYVKALTDSLEVATEFLGTGWARKQEPTDEVQLPFMLHRSRSEGGKGGSEDKVGPVPAMSALIFADGRLRLTGDPVEVSAFLASNGFGQLPIDGRGVNVPSHMSQQVRSLLGLPELPEQQSEISGVPSLLPADREIAPTKRRRKSKP